MFSFWIDSSRQRIDWRDIVGSMFQNCAAATGNARSPTVDTVWTAESANGSIRQSGVLVDQTCQRHGPTNWGSVVSLSLHAGLCMSEQPFYTVSVRGLATSGDGHALIESKTNPNRIPSTPVRNNISELWRPSGTELFSAYSVPQLCISTG